jgi:hypothetical protein
MKSKRAKKEFQTAFTSVSFFSFRVRRLRRKRARDAFQNTYGSRPAPQSMRLWLLPKESVAVEILACFLVERDGKGEGFP